MARDLSPIIESIRQSDTQNVWLAIDITTLDGDTVRAAEVELEVTSLNLIGTSVDVDPVLYPATLMTNPAIKYSKGKAPNGGSFTILDLDHALGILVGQIERKLDGASVVVTTCWEKPDETFEADIYFKGLIRDVSAEDETTNFTIVADTDSRTAYVANRSLTQRCLAVYGDNRCRRPAGMILPGETCSNIFDDAENGCLAKRWQFAFWGVPILRLSESTANGGWGSGSTGGSGCPTLDQTVNIYRSKFDTVPMRVADLREGMICVDALERCAVIDYLRKIEGSLVYQIETANGARKKVSESHPVILNLQDNRGTRVSDLRAGQKVLTKNRLSRKIELSPLRKVEVIGRETVMEICLSNRSAALYSISDSAEVDAWTIEAHNNKLPTANLN